MNKIESMQSIVEISTWLGVVVGGFEGQKKLMLGTVPT